MAGINGHPDGCLCVAWECQVYRLRAKITRLESDLFRLKEHKLRVGDLPKEVVEANAVLEWVVLTLEGAEVSDFAQSFGPVQKAMNIRAELEALREQVD